MSVINKGTSFSNGEQLTAKKINDMVDLATFDQSATDSASTTVNSVSQIIVRDGGITAAKLATDSVETVKILDSTSKTDGVTLPKIQFIDTAKVLGRTTAEAGNVEELDFKTETDMASDSDTAVASQKSIKAYVDASSTAGFTPTAMASDTKSVTLPNGLIMKFGTKTGLTGEGNYTVDLSSESADFPNACLNASATAINANGGDAGANDYWMQVKSISSSEIVYVFQATSTPESGASFFWQAIGH
tara:strand:+ start:774 stop:1511 length:738 start_codon:yes stop_codon:yes gene_type:complete